MADYQFLITDALTGRVIEDMPFLSVQYRKGRKQPGSLTCSISSRHPKATQENLTPVKNIINVMRDGVCVWSGPIWLITADDFFGEQITINAEGMFSYFTEGRRTLRDDYGFGGDALVWANTLVKMAQVGTGYDLRIGTNDSVTSNELAYIDYDVGIEDLRCIGDDIVQQAGAGRNEDGYYQGFDFDVIGKATNDVFRYSFEIGWPTFQSSWSDQEKKFVPQPLRFIDVDSASVAKYGLRMNGKEMARLIDVVGDMNEIVTVTDNKSIAAEYPVVERKLQYDAVGDDSLLHALGDAAMRKRVLPVSLPMLTVAVDNEVPVYSLRPGSYVQLEGGVGYVKGKRLAEIEAWEVSVDSEGKEIATVQFTEVPETDPVLSTGSPVVLLRTPVVTVVTPDRGRLEGGTRVTITGSGFTKATAVYFGDIEATSFSVTSDTKIVAVAPPGTQDTAVYVQVAAGDLISSASNRDQDYLYYDASTPVITSITPTSGPSAGGTTVTVTGINFKAVMSVQMHLRVEDPAGASSTTDGVTQDQVTITDYFVDVTSFSIKNTNRLTLVTPGVFFVSVPGLSRAWVHILTMQGSCDSPLEFTYTG